MKDYKLVKIIFYQKGSDKKIMRLLWEENIIDLRYFDFVISRIAVNNNKYYER